MASRPLRSARPLTITATRHALDTVENIGAFVTGAPGEYRAHSWSDARFDGRDPATFDAMWFAPQRLGTGYRSEGFEIAAGYRAPGSFLMTPEKALSGWQGSAGHNAVILNQGPWDLAWNAVGVAMYKGVASVWFGVSPDLTGAPLGYGNLGGDTSEGGDSYDIVRGGGGDDVVRGGAGDDVVSRDNGNTVLDAEDGDRMALAGVQPSSLSSDWIFQA